MKANVLKKGATLKEALERGTNYIKAWIAMGMVMLYTVPVKADLMNPDKVSINSKANSDDIFGKVLGFIFEIVTYGGIVLAVFGLVKLISAIQEQQGDRIRDAIFMMGGGIALAFAKTLFKNLGLIS